MQLAYAARACSTGGTDAGDRLVVMVERFIQQRWSEPGFGVDAIASELGIHRSTLSRRFSAATGAPLIDSLVATRMQHAMSMLRGARKSVGEVASECGYGDANYFCRIFKEKIGMTPSQFRKRH